MLPPMNPDDGGYGYDDRPDRRGRQKKNNTSTILLVVAGILVLVGAILIGKWVFSEKNADESFGAPTFVGNSYATAQKMASNRELKLAPPTRKPCANQPKGNVCSQDPRPGTDVKKGDTINIVVSTGAPKVAVPDVTGLTFAKAEATLKAKGFAVDRKDQVTSDRSPGIVITQDPRGDAEKEKGTTITLTVAKAEEKVTIPDDLVGKSCDDAKAELQNLGLAPNCADTPTNDPNQDGKVISTNPTAGEQVVKNTAVAINVGKAQGNTGQVQVPNIQGQKLKDAKAMLQQAGLQVGNITGSQDDNAIVFTSNPGQGSTVQQGSAVDLITVGQGGNGNNGGNDGGTGLIGGAGG